MPRQPFDLNTQASDYFVQEPEEEEKDECQELLESILPPRSCLLANLSADSDFDKKETKYIGIYIRSCLLAI